MAQSALRETAAASKAQQLEAELRQALGQGDRAVQELQARTAELQQRCTKADAEAEAAAQRIGECEERVGVSMVALTRANEEKAGWVRRCEAAEAQNSTMSSGMTELELEVGQGQARLQDLQEALRAAKAEVGRLEGKVTELEGGVSKRQEVSVVCPRRDDGPGPEPRVGLASCPEGRAPAPSKK